MTETLISNDLKCMTFSKNDISRIENEAYNQALEDLVKKCEKATFYQFGQYYVDMRDVRKIKKELSK